MAVVYLLIGWLAYRVSVFSGGRVCSGVMCWLLKLIVWYCGSIDVCVTVVLLNWMFVE